MRYGPGSQPLHGVAQSRPVYLPAGTDWYDFWSDQKFDGGQTILVPKDQVYNLRLSMSGKGLPSGQGTGYALLDRFVDALRLVEGDTHLAEDVAQTVFMDLARKARSMSSAVMLGGWLHQRTFNVAAPMMRATRRRAFRKTA